MMALVWPLPYLSRCHAGSGPINSNCSAGASETTIQVSDSRFEIAFAPPPYENILQSCAFHKRERMHLQVQC